MGLLISDAAFAQAATPEMTLYAARMQAKAIEAEAYAKAEKFKAAAALAMKVGAAIPTASETVAAPSAPPPSQPDAAKTVAPVLPSQEGSKPLPMGTLLAVAGLVKLFL